MKGSASKRQRTKAKSTTTGSSRAASSVASQTSHSSLAALGPRVAVSASGNSSSRATPGAFSRSITSGTAPASSRANSGHSAVSTRRSLTASSPSSSGYPTQLHRAPHGQTSRQINVAALATPVGTLLSPITESQKVIVPTPQDIAQEFQKIDEVISSGKFKTFTHQEQISTLKPLTTSYWEKKIGVALGHPALPSITALSSSFTTPDGAISTDKVESITKLPPDLVIRNRLFDQHYRQALALVGPQTLEKINSSLEVYTAHRRFNESVLRALNESPSSSSSSSSSSSGKKSGESSPSGGDGAPNDGNNKDKKDKNTDKKTKKDKTTKDDDNKEKKSSQADDDESQAAGLYKKLQDNWKKTRDKTNQSKIAAQKDSDENIFSHPIFKSWFTRIFLATLAAGTIISGVTQARQYFQRKKNTYSEFFMEYLSKDLVQTISLRGNTAVATLKDGDTYAFDVLSQKQFGEKINTDIEILQLDNLPIMVMPQINPAEYLHLGSLLGTGIVILLLSKNLRKMVRGVSRSRTPGAMKKFTMEKNITTKFIDVAGMDEAKAEIMEFVDFLKHPEKYTRLGAKLPKGALLSGPPGTGKTLLAKATAGEAGVPFFSVSGSDFQAMYVGMGAKHVRDLFSEARKHAPSIIFIDEIDAVARSRSKSMQSGHDEREATLNQLLVEMDGFKSNEAVIVMAATNRAELLDSAILRPGRFDRKIQVDAPDLEGRKQIYLVHLKKLKLNHDMQELAAKISALTPGMVGADIANVCNEAAIGAARNNRSAVELIDFEQAVDRVLGGLAKKKSIMTSKEREIVAYHESGHAVAGWFLKYADPLLKVTIVPRTSGALGFAQYLPKESGLYHSDQLKDMIAMALAGRAAEQVFFGRISTGASDDLKKVMRIAQGMILQYGMGSNLPNVAYGPLEEDNYYKTMSEKTNFTIDTEVGKIVEAEYLRIVDLLHEKKQLVESLAKSLLTHETVNHEMLVTILGERPNKNDAYIQYMEMQKQELKTLDEKKHQGGDDANANDTNADTSSTDKNEKKD